MRENTIYDVGIIGCGIAGMATALRLQAKGYSTLIVEAHGQPGGCAGFFTKRGFAFDVGATTLVDFDEDGVGGRFFNSVGMTVPESEKLDYTLWLPDRTVTMYHDQDRWHQERLLKFGDTPAHRAFWQFMDRLAIVFWNASRRGIKLPIQSVHDIVQAIRAVGPSNLLLCRYIRRTFLDALKKFNLQNDTALRSTLAMLIEDTVHSKPEDAPLINAALGITIRGAGLRRARGGMKGLWDHFIKHYRAAGGRLVVGTRITNIESANDVYRLHSRRGVYTARKIVSAVPADVTFAMAPAPVKEKLNRYLVKQNKHLGGAIVMFLGVPEAEVSNHNITHHQLLHNYDAPLGNGNNMFISVSSPGDTQSAPEGYRAVMLSTHCGVDEWENLSDDAYESKKQRIGERLLTLARTVYPELGKNAVIYEVGTPRTYHTYTGRIRGAVGGVKQNIDNANFAALPHDIGIKNFRLAGDTTWPGLGTVACILGSGIVADQLSR